MKASLLALSVLLSTLSNLAFSATPDEEARFLKAVQDAYASRDKDAIIALTCWDRVSDKHKALAPKVLDHALSRPIKSVQYCPLDLSEPQTYTNDGVTYGPNLLISKEIEIQYEDAAGQPQMRSVIYAGEKDGKLMIVNLAPEP